MTGNEKFPIGKYKGTTLADLKKTQPAYVNWFLEQEWSAEKYPDIFEYLSGKTVPTQNEQGILDEEKRLLNSMPAMFEEWFISAYGQLRSSNSPLYLPYLRVAIEAWRARDRLVTESFLKPNGP